MEITHVRRFAIYLAHDDYEVYVLDDYGSLVALSMDGILCNNQFRFSLKDTM